MLIGAYASQNFDFEWDVDPRPYLFYFIVFLLLNDYQRIIEMYVNLISTSGTRVPI